MFSETREDPDFVGAEAEITGGGVSLIRYISEDFLRMREEITTDDEPLRFGSFSSVAVV